MESHRILLAEDNVDLAKIVRLNLEAAGFRVACAASGREAVVLARREQFDLVLTDQNMPQLTGIELCRLLRADARYATTPMVLLTAVARLLDEKSVMEELRLAAIVSKPYSQRELCETIASALENAKQEQSLAPL